MTTTFTREQLERMTPSQIEEAIHSIQASPLANQQDEPRTVGQVIRRTDPNGAGFTQPTEAQVLSDAGLWPVYDLRTGVSSIILKNLLPAKLKEIDEQGRLVYTTDRNLAPTPIEPTYPCMLHPQNAYRAEADRLGFSVCMKMLNTAFDAERHSRKHKGAWDTFRKAEEDQEKQEERSWRQTSMDALTTAATAAAQTRPVEYEKTCIGCGDAFRSVTEDSAETKMVVHQRACEPYQDTFGGKTPQERTAERVANQPTAVKSDVQAAVLKQEGVSPYAQWCKVDGCDHISDARSVGGAKARMRKHVREEHSNA